MTIDLLVLSEELAADAREAVEGQVSVVGARLDNIVGVSAEQLAHIAANENGLLLFHAGQLAGFMRTAH
ncbi:MAG: hypothetical protein QF726_08705 [Alphaproteobacteria bacterium]|jgi:hypothetical protein|nr:hypothetical protein [Alphaproteobacteria bacterium]MEE1543739.1 hypothetical protein [Alphaproteobacteria bacterium]|tara:strand:+ start:81 stop:287 length:207 start_codon:yes stop_codon:yes gene_type:complete